MLAAGLVPLHPQKGYEGSGVMLNPMFRMLTAGIGGMYALFAPCFLVPRVIVQSMSSAPRLKGSKRISGRVQDPLSSGEGPISEVCEVDAMSL